MGRSEALETVKRLARKAARTPSTVLITGESGTGKELLARAIHAASPFAEGPFVSVNCAAIPENLLEAELFGYEEGAFTGARKGGKPGKIELADGGTLFLDEIGDMPLAMQAKLLRVLEERRVERVGGVTSRPVRVRVIAATNRSLEEMVRKGAFRADLYYRLNIIRLHLPPLRERRTDIPLLLSHHLERVVRRYRLPAKSFTKEAVSILLAYHWPGNVRELVNTVEALVNLVDGPDIRPEDLLPHPFGGENAGRPGRGRGTGGAVPCAGSEAGGGRAGTRAHSGSLVPSRGKQGEGGAAPRHSPLHVVREAAEIRLAPVRSSASQTGNMTNRGSRRPSDGLFFCGRTDPVRVWFVG